jgi:hypothetical protein
MSAAVVGSSFRKAAPSFVPRPFVVLVKQDGTVSVNGATTTGGSSPEASLRTSTSAIQGQIHAVRYLGGRDVYPRRRKKGRDDWSVGKSDTADPAAVLMQRLEALRADILRYYYERLPRVDDAEPGMPPVEQLQAPDAPILIKFGADRQIILKGRNASAKALMALAQAYPDLPWENAWGQRQFGVTGRNAYEKVLAVLSPLGRVEHIRR